MKIKVLFILILLSSLAYGQESLFPKITGWNAQIEEQVYDSNNLWDLIDGAADLFLEYSFIDMRLARYMNADNIEVKAEIYKHATPLDAFGIYSQERDPGYKFMLVGVQGYIEEGILNFLDGVYYIKLSTIQKGDKAQDALVLIAKQLDGHLKQGNSFPAELSYLPAESRNLNSEKYISQNFLGHSFFKSVITAIYKGTPPFAAFIINAGTGDNAAAVLDKYLEAAGKSNPEKIAAGHYKINDELNGLIEMIVLNKYIYGVIGCSDNTKKEKLFDKIKESLLKN